MSLLGRSPPTSRNTDRQQRTRHNHPPSMIAAVEPLLAAPTVSAALTDWE